MFLIEAYTNSTLTPCMLSWRFITAIPTIKRVLSLSRQKYRATKMILLSMLFSPFEYFILNFHIVKASIKKNSI